MRTTIFRAEICGAGDTPEDAEINWKRKVRRMMEAVRLVHTAPPVEFLDRVATMLKAFEAASDPRQETPWPESVVPKITALDRLENSFGSSKKEQPPF